MGYLPELFLVFALILFSQLDELFLRLFVHLHQGLVHVVLVLPVGLFVELVELLVQLYVITQILRFQLLYNLFRVLLEILPQTPARLVPLLQKLAVLFLQ